MVTAIPLRAGGFMSDWMQFVEVIRGGRAVEERGAAGAYGRKASAARGPGTSIAR